MTNPAACARGNATPPPDALLGPVSRYLCALGWGSRLKVQARCATEPSFPTLLPFCKSSQGGDLARPKENRARSS